MTLTRTAFTAERALHVYELTRKRLDLPEADAELIRIGENALIRSLPYVVRIARAEDAYADACKEVAVSHWLNTSGLRASRTSEHEQPVTVEGHPVTVWRFLTSTGRKASAPELATLLSQLHRLPSDGRPEDLPEFDLFGRVDARLDHPDAPADAVAYLRDELARLRADYAALEYPSQPTALHGDAHVQNVMITEHGCVLIDFERFGIGHPEDDLAVTATEHSVGWHTDDDYRAFCRAYGTDVTEWEGFETLRRINLLKMTSWLMQNVHNSPDKREEFDTRLATLRDGTAPRPWKPF